jgi:AcrR family transcriptional regulator
MATTKEKIIETSIKLFNEKGCLNTSTRHISDELGISVGNLYYHFKNKEEIVIEIYEIFSKKLSSHIHFSILDEEIVFNFTKFIGDYFIWETEFKFLRVEISYIYKSFPNVRLALEDFLEYRNRQLVFLYKHQQKYGYMKEIDDIELKFAISNIWTIVYHWDIYWILNNKENYDEKQKLKNGLLNFLYFFKPYMTEKGLKESKLEILIKDILNDKIF